MHLNDFDKNLMATRVVFNEDNIKEGDLITLYKIDATSTQSTIVEHGIVEDVTPTVIKYAYFDSGIHEVNSNYLYPSEILIDEPTDKQWEGKEHLILFTITPGKRG